MFLFSGWIIIYTLFACIFMTFCFINNESLWHCLWCSRCLSIVNDANSDGVSLLIGRLWAQCSYHVQIMIKVAMAIACAILLLANSLMLFTPEKVSAFFFIFHGEQYDNWWCGFMMASSSWILQSRGQISSPFIGSNCCYIGPITFSQMQFTIFVIDFV